MWHKRSLFEQCARVPLIVYAPGAKGNGGRSTSLVELLDLYPTLCDLAGVPAPSVLEGKSLRSVLDDPREDALIAHELSHQWWGNLLTCADWSDFWLNEGMATYMTAAWKEHAWSRDDYEREMLLARPNIVRLALGPRILRADTAAVAALALVEAVLGDWRAPG